MKSQIGQGIVYLPPGNRSGSIKCLNLATGTIVTRDHIKIVPSTTIKIMNDLAALDKRYMPEISPAVHDLIYNQSVAETNTPTIFPVQPPLSDMGTLAIIPDNPNPTVPLVFTDRLVPVTTATDDIIHHDKGGGVQHKYYQSKLCSMTSLISIISWYR
jgi:hypothetical protein